MSINDITFAEVLNEIDRCIIDARLEREKVLGGTVFNSSHPNPAEYLYFLGSSERAFNGLRRHLRSEEFMDKILERRKVREQINHNGDKQS